MSHHDSNTFFESYFEDRLAQIEPNLIRWARWKYSMATEYDREEALQNTRIVLWKRYSESPEEWAPLTKEKWLAYARGAYRYEMLGKYRDRKREPVKSESDMECIVNDQDITGEEALAMTHPGSRSKPNQFARSREIELVELRIDLQRAIQRGLRRWCKSQQRDMPKLIQDMLTGYTLDEITERHGWTRNRGVTRAPRIILLLPQQIWNIMDIRHM